MVESYHQKATTTLEVAIQMSTEMACIQLVKDIIHIITTMLQTATTKKLVAIVTDQMTTIFNDRSDTTNRRSNLVIRAIRTAGTLACKACAQ